MCACVFMNMKDSEKEKKKKSRVYDVNFKIARCKK